MAERKLLEVDTTPETPHSKGTISVRTGRSDPPPSLFPTPRPAAGLPPSQAPGSSPRSATTIRSPKPLAPSKPALGPSPRWLGAAVFVLFMSALVVMALHGHIR